MKARTIIAPAAGIIVFFGLWELFVRVGDVPTYALRAPSEILNYMFTEDIGLLQATLETSADAAQSIAFAALIGFALGAVMAASRWFEEASLPVLILIQVTPWVAYSGSVVLLFQGGRAPVVFIATLVCVPAFAFAATVGLRSADPAAVELFRSVNAGRMEMLWRLRVPYALPGLFTAMRFSVGLALAAVYFTEGGALTNRGLGLIGVRALRAQAPLPLWSTVFCTALIGVVFLVVIGVAERFLLGWHASQRRASR